MMGDSAAADVEKAKGNALYKQRKFDEVVAEGTVSAVCGLLLW